MTKTKFVRRKKRISGSSNPNQGLIIGIVVLFFLWGLFIGKYISSQPTALPSKPAVDTQSPQNSQQQASSPFLIGEVIQGLSGNIAPSLSIKNATAYSHILQTHTGLTLALKSKHIDLGDLSSPVLILSGEVVDITPDWLPVVEVFAAQSLAEQQEQKEPELNIIAFTWEGFRLNFGTNTWMKAYIEGDKLIILSWDEKVFEGYLKQCQSIGMSCDRLHQTFKNVSPPLTNQYGLDFFRYAETTGSWIVIFDNKFMNMFGSEDYIKSYFNYFEPLTSQAAGDSQTQDQTSSQVEAQTADDQASAEAQTQTENETSDQTQPAETNTDTISYTFKAWFTVQFPKTSVFGMVPNQTETLGDCPYVINVIHYKNQDQLEQNPDLQIFVCDSKPQEVPEGGKLVEAAGKYFVILPRTNLGSERAELIQISE